MKSPQTGLIFLAPLLVFLLMPGIQSCKDKDDIPQDTPFYVIDPVLKSFAYYNYGSWFNYYDSANQTFDSLFVTSLYHDTLFESSGYRWGKHEVIHCQMKSLTEDIVDLVIRPGLNKENRQGIFYYKSTFDNKSYEFTPILSPVKIGQFSSNFPKTTEIIAFLDSLPVGDRVFREIIQVEITKDFVLDSDTSYLYYAKNIGLVKWHSKDYSKNITLHHYHISR